MLNSTAEKVYLYAAIWILTGLDHKQDSTGQLNWSLLKLRVRAFCLQAEAGRKPVLNTSSAFLLISILASCFDQGVSTVTHINDSIYAGATADLRLECVTSESLLVDTRPAI